jgi:hypothetical protein
MKYVPVYALLLLVAFYPSSRGQTQKDLPTDIIRSGTKDVLTSRVPDSITRIIRQDRKGNIWIATFQGIFRYDGNSGYR